MNITRRHALASATGLCGLAVLSACAGNTVTVAQFAADAATIANGLNAVLPTIAALAGVPTETIAQISADVAAAQGAAVALGAVAAGQAPPVTVVQVLVTAVNDVVALSTIAPLSVLIPQPIEMVLVAAKALLPAIEAAAGLASAGEVPAMSPDAARLILKAAGK
jgi:hypothetical protein